MTMWALWAAIEAEPHAINIIYHRVSNAGRPMDPKIADAAVEALRGPFAVLDARSPGRPSGRRPLHRRRHQRRRGDPLCPGRARAVRDGAAREGLARACQARPAFRKMWASARRSRLFSHHPSSHRLVVGLRDASPKKVFCLGPQRRGIEPLK
jgi:glutathione S-transferase